MKNINLKVAIICILSVSFIIGLLLFKIEDSEVVTEWNFIKLIPKIVSIDLVIISIFSLYLWKWKIFKGWLVPFPNLNGTWKGFIHTTWTDPKTGERPAPIPAIVTIKQSFFKISCIMRTAEMCSRSLTSDFVLDKDNQIKKLYYSYDSNPIQTVKERSPQHSGTMAFDIIEKPKKKLTGEYWTGRKTTGQIEMTYWKKELLEDYPTELGTHPVSEVRRNKR